VAGVVGGKSDSQRLKGGGREIALKV